MRCSLIQIFTMRLTTGQHFFPLQLAAHHSKKHGSEVARSTDSRHALLLCHFRKSRMLSAISRACVSSAKWPVSKKRTTARGLSRLKASAPGGTKNGSFLPHTAKNGGL